MKRISFPFTLLVMACTQLAADQDRRCFEMRTYYAAPGQLDTLLARFREHTCKLFEKHGMENIGYWVPTENPDHKLIYLLAYPSREARQQAWKEFGADPAWQKARRESESKANLVAKVESRFLTATDYSPPIKPSRGTETRLFELRTYTAAPGKLDALNQRFREHTVKLFAKHGMTNIGYWTPSEKGKGAEDTLIYILAHKSKDAAEKSFKAFREDPAWIKAKGESEKAAGGSLTLGGPTGVQSLFMTPTDFSPIQ